MSRIVRKRRKPPIYAVVTICCLVALELQYNVATTRGLVLSQNLMQQLEQPGVLIFDTTIDHNAASAKRKEKETAILITTNWIPSAPSPALLLEVIDSIELMFEGLPHNTPMYILIDEPEYSKKATPKERWDKEATLEIYSTNLMKEFMHKTNSTFRYYIISNHANQHIGGNLNKTLHLLDPETEFLYFFQHDFKFIQTVNHTAIIKTMRDFPDVVKNIRFNKSINGRRLSRAKVKHPCWNITDGVQDVNGIHLTRTDKWSDNNHFASVEYYKWLLEAIGNSIHRPLENMMMNSLVVGNNTCNLQTAQHLYGAPYEPPYLQHLDGRLGYMVEKKMIVKEAAVIGTTSNATSMEAVAVN